MFLLSHTSVCQDTCQKSTLPHYHINTLNKNQHNTTKIENCVLVCGVQRLHQYSFYIPLRPCILLEHLKVMLALN